MSHQTHEVSPAGPASGRVGDRVRFALTAWTASPNPILVRELRQLGRLQRTPLLLTGVVLTTTLLLSLVGLAMSGDRSPAWAGSVLHQVFFAVGYFVTMLVGPVVAANAIASEREGRTWEAMLLTGLPPEVIARGKFAAAYGALATYLVALAPVGALPLVFGGVSPIEIALGFVFLFALGALAVAMGLALSSKLASGRSAMVITFLACGPASLMAFSFAGAGGSIVAHTLWPQVPEGAPIWWPTACSVAPVDFTFAVVLVGMPLAFFALPAWFFYEATVAAIATDADRPDVGLKRWYLTSVAVLTAAGVLLLTEVPLPGSRVGASVFVGLVTLAFSALSAVVFQTEALYPSRRARHLLAKHPPKGIARFLPARLCTTAAWMMVLGPVPIVTTAVIAGVLDTATALGTVPDEAMVRAMVPALHLTGLHVLFVGMMVWLRARRPVSPAARVVLVAVGIGFLIIPWLVAAFTAAFTQLTFDACAPLAAPSPLFAATITDGRQASHVAAAWVVGAVGMLVGLLALLRSRALARRAEEGARRIDDDVDRRLAEEDAARAQPLGEAG